MVMSHYNSSDRPSYRTDDRNGRMYDDRSRSRTNSPQLARGRDQQHESPGGTRSSPHGKS